MHPYKPPAIDLKELAELLAYEPATGAITWRKNVGPKAKAGELAGIARPSGVVITVKGQKIGAPYIAYALHHGAWPPTRLALHGLRANRRQYAGDLPEERRLLAVQDLRIDNIVPASKFLKHSPHAIARRQYTKELRDRARVNKRGGVGFEYESIVHWSDYWQEWQVMWTGPAPDYEKVSIAGFKRLPDAKAYATEYLHGRHLVHDLRPPAVPLELAQRTAGINGATFLRICTLLVHSEETGGFYWRPANELLDWRAHPAYDGTRADHTYRGLRYVTLDGRRYPAHALAWFLDTGEWPAAKSLTWANGVKNDNRTENIILLPKERAEWLALKDIEPDIDPDRDPGNRHYVRRRKNGGIEEKPVTWDYMAEAMRYDPDTGLIYDRKDDDRPFYIANPSGQAQFINVFSRLWGVHLLAVFLTTGRWPKPRTVRWVNGNQSDNRLKNLEVRKDAFDGKQVR